MRYTLRLVLIITGLFLLMAFLTRISPFGVAGPDPQSLMALGFTLIAAYLTGKILNRFQLPKLTGYIVAGIIAGPFVANLLSPETVVRLQLIDQIALGLIALTAGGEFYYRDFVRQFKTTLSIIGWLIPGIMLAIMLLIWLVHPRVPFLNGQPFSVIMGAGMLFGIISITMSPATTIAIITETNSKGRLTDMVLGINIFIDIIVVFLFSIVLSISRPLILADSTFQFHETWIVLREIFFSIVVGTAAGGLILLYLKFVKKQTGLFLLGFVLLGIEIAAKMHLEIILLFISAGFFVRNFSDAGSHLIEAIEDSSLPVYVIFFAITGASLNFELLFANWLLAILLVGVRMGALAGGSYMGARTSGAPPAIRNYTWMGLSGQAGISIGLAVLIVQNIPGSLGVNIKSLIISMVAINQILGPVLFRYSLGKAGEIAEAPEK